MSYILYNKKKKKGTHAQGGESHNKAKAKVPVPKKAPSRGKQILTEDLFQRTKEKMGDWYRKGGRSVRKGGTYDANQ